MNIDLTKVCKNVENGMMNGDGLESGISVEYIKDIDDKFCNIYLNVNNMPISHGVSIIEDNDIEKAEYKAIEMLIQPLIANSAWIKVLKAKKNNLGK